MHCAVGGRGTGRCLGFVQELHSLGACRTLHSLTEHRGAQRLTSLGPVAPWRRLHQLTKHRIFTGPAFQVTRDLCEAAHGGQVRGWVGRWGPGGVCCWVPTANDSEHAQKSQNALQRCRTAKA